ncbi:hypothetical protein [Xanthomonas maliensis]|uniref:hypothetical protein n=1 Tax=Xanthomonas maliensis TaxID=1321368 RepID=UPI00039D3662|nr:hypothetical protein [Xanthomonas maliensis]KAB7762489.1 hypothetical protein CKY51_21310 [Xanthomonas maliensis]
MDHLHLRDRRGYLGAWTPDQVQADYRQGRYRADTLSWAPGEARWCSLERRWQPRRWPWQGLRIAAALLACLLLGVVLPLWSLQSPGALLIPLPWHLALAAIAVLGSVALLARAIVRDRGTGTSRGWLMVWLLLLALPLMVALLHQMASTERDRQGHANARMRLSADGRVLQIDGSIGARFVPDFRAALARAPQLQRVDIDSGGGLVTDALQAVEQIRARRLVVRVNNTCASACVLLWAASPARELSLRGRIGLHQAQVPGRVPEQWRSNALQDLTDRSRKVLIGAGFGPGLLSAWRTTPATSMYWADASMLMADGVQVRVVDAQGLPATAAQRAMAGALQQMNASDASWQLYLAYAEQQPKQAPGYANAIAQSLLAKDEQRAIDWIVALNGRIDAFAFDHASDAQLLRWGKAMAALWEQASRQESLGQCNALLDTGERPIDQPTRQRIRSLLATLVAEIAPGAPARPLNPRQQDQAEAALRRAAAEVRMAASTNRADGGMTRLRCTRMAQAYRDALTLPSAEAALRLRMLQALVLD